ncbi:phospholipid-translocating P-type ATPase [Violaceomyces palustris]|uniref:Phospholipid-translocating P-type ATPase n=1 Tax=Violaceomyces palustris TaxID=1673888 RepID=A0ACD0NTP5_9BASI|nr:phospholipid-translocating P-type ATPase [Violaceomyces palustris]
MVFGRSDSRRRQPSLDQQGHIYDENYMTPYDTGPASHQYITDPTHPDYDPMVDPNLQLRTVRTAAASIAESHRSEQRREARQKAKKHGSLLGKLGRGRTLRRRDGSKKGSALAGLVQDEIGKRRSKSGAFVTGEEDTGLTFDSAQPDDRPFEAALDAAENEASASDEEEKEEDEGPPPKPDGPTVKKMKPKKRRNVYLNMPLASSELSKNGDPLNRYPRNKVRTSKYTIVTFLPRFLFEQFRRIANIYFLGLVVLQVFPTFGATIPQIAMLPLVAILTITAIKDSMEDYRRHVLDNQVNNSAVTRLGNWRNVNQPRDPRNFLEKLLGIGHGPAHGKVSKGVRKLREKEDAIGMRVVPGRSVASDPQSQGYNGGTDMGPRVTTHTGRSDSLTSSNALHTIVSESERDDAMSSVAGHTALNSSAPHSMSRNSSGTAMMTQGPSSLGHGSVPDGVVDYKRHTPGTARWERTLWKKLEVGDIVLLRDDDQVPADIVILNTSDPDGCAYIETKNLDGETNLKVRKCLKATAGIQSEEDLEHARFVIDSEAPHANLYAYNGLLKYTVSSSGQDPDSSWNYTDEPKGAPVNSSAFAASQAHSRRVEPVTINELLLRGCALRNTDWVIGMVVFTGEDTKIMLNSGETPSKRSKIEKETNFNVLMNFIILLALCLTCAIVGGLELNRTDTSRAFYEAGAEISSSNIINALVIFGSCLVLFQNIVPISLYISIEIVKTIQAFFIFQDVEMYYEPLDYPCVPKTWNISDDLGQIEYIFSDKTGTLTQNVMEFKKCSINGIPYGDGVTEAMVGAMKREGKDTSGFSAEAQQAELEEAKDSMVRIMNRAFKNRYLRPEQLTLISTKLAETLAQGPNSQSSERKNIITFFRALALCHTALADRPDGNQPFTVEYKAQSPDEAALVSAARDVGSVFISKNNQTIDIEVLGQPERYTPLRILEFNSTRKRMSVIVREPEGRILMITKGADSVIYQRLREDHPQELKMKTQKDLEDFANAGLRTLCIAYRYLEEGEFAEWARLHDEAAASLTDRDEAIDAVAERIEVGLTLLGATALEDKLQKGVPESIATLRQAGIKLWILTGDKLQTAIEIGFSCNLLSSDMEIMIISADHEQGTRAQLEAACNKIAAAGRPVVIEEPGKNSKKKSQKLSVQATEDAPVDGFAVVIDGETLRYALDKNLKPLFLALTTQCEAVVCCRVSPAQKALTVKLVKDGRDAMTLAIGDGANDVAMIQEAHVGVGIAGLEGAQASYSADYAIGQFRFLTRLLLVHGHWSYMRVSLLHLIFFYKNVIWTFTMFYFQIYCDFSAAYLYDYSYVLLYNLVFSSLCVIVIGALDQDINQTAALRIPSTYSRGIQGLEYTRAKFFMAMFDAAYQGAACFFIPWAMWTYFPVVGANGQEMNGIWFFGTTIGAGVVTSANLYAGLVSNYWSGIFIFVEVISILSYYVWTFIYSAFPSFTFDDVGFWLAGTILFWTSILLTVAASLLPRFFARAWRCSFQPNINDIVREGWVKGTLKDELGVPHRKEKKNRKMAARRDLERGGQDRVLVAAPQSSSANEVKETSPKGGISERSADSFPAVANYESGYDPHIPASPAERSQRNGAISGLSYYDPDQIPSPMVGSESPYPTRFDQEQQQRYYEHGPGQHLNQGGGSADVPMINVQRASSSTYGYDPQTTPQQQQYPAFADAATSQTRLNSMPSNDSFNRSFDEAFGEEEGFEQFRQPYQSPIKAGVNYHDRFKTNPPPTDQTVDNSFEVEGGYTYRDGQRDDLYDESADSLPSPPTGLHYQDHSGVSDVSWHTAGESREGNHTPTARTTRDW